MSKLNVYFAVLLVAGASCARLDHLVPQGNDGAGGGVQPFHFENVNNGDRTYSFSFDTPNGITERERRASLAQGSQGHGPTVVGGFSCRSSKGQQISVTFTADENGFEPVGSNLPTPPPIPADN